MKFRSSSLILGVLALALTASLSAAQSGTAAPAKPAAAPVAKTTTTVTSTTTSQPAANTMTSTTTTKTGTKTHMVAAKTRVDINSAAKEDLTKLPGITEDIADKIIAGRPYKSKADLVKNKTLTAAQYSKVRLKIVAKQAAK